MTKIFDIRDEPAWLGSGMTLLKAYFLDRRSDTIFKFLHDMVTGLKQITLRCFEFEAFLIRKFYALFHMFLSLTSESLEESKYYCLNLTKVTKAIKSL